VKHLAQEIFRETLAAIDIPAALARKLERSGSRILVQGQWLDLSAFREIFAVAIGKASLAMADGLVRFLQPDFAAKGILVAPAPPPCELPGWQVFQGGHPLPNEQSFAAGRAVLEFLSRAGNDSLIFFLLSGGGSAMVEQPLDPSITLEDFRSLHQALVTCGAPIEQINVVRKHLSATKGGRLAAAAPHATKITLGVSDVPAGQESALASGPTIPDPSTAADAYRVAHDCGLHEKFPPSVRRIFQRNELRETPKHDHPAFRCAYFALLLSEHDLLHAAHHACERHGITCLADDLTDSWSIEKSSTHLLQQLRIFQRDCGNRRAAVIADGEVSSPVTGKGLGGRNSAFVLACVPKIAGQKITVLSAGTDGIDGNSPAAGAVADGDTLAHAAASGLDPQKFLEASDS
jgi:glycerate 2-kinase